MVAADQLIKSKFAALDDHLFRIIAVHHNFVPTLSGLKKGLIGKDAIFLQEADECAIDLILSRDLHERHRCGLFSSGKNTESEL